MSNCGRRQGRHGFFSPFHSAGSGLGAEKGEPRFQKGGALSWSQCPKSAWGTAWAFTTDKYASSANEPRWSLVLFPIPLGAAGNLCLLSLELGLHVRLAATPFNCRAPRPGGHPCSGISVHLFIMVFPQSPTFHHNVPTAASQVREPSPGPHSLTSAHQPTTKSPPRLCG